MEGAHCWIPEGIEIHCPYNGSMESIVSQLQPYCDKILTVIDGQKLRIYSDLNQIPPGRRGLENTLQRLNGRDFYIRDLEENQQICCFSEEVKDQLLKTRDESIPQIKLPQIVSSNREIPGKSESILESSSDPLIYRLDNSFKTLEKKPKERKICSLETTLPRDPKIYDQILDISLPLIPAPSFSRKENL